MMNLIDRGAYSNQVLGMRDDESGQSGPSTLWVMAGSQSVPVDATRGVDQVATPLPVVVTAAGLVAAVRPGPEAARRSQPQVAQWDAIRSHYRDVADWIDRDAAGQRPAATDANPAGRMSPAGVVDYLGRLAGIDDVRRWLSTRPDYWVCAGESVDAATTAVAEFRRDYRRAAVIGPITIYRRCATPG